MVLEIIDKVIHVDTLLLFLSPIGLDHRSSAHIPYPNCAVRATREHHGLVVRDPDRLYHASVTATLEQAFVFWSAHVMHVQRVICVSDECDIASIAAAKCSWARVHPAYFHRMRNLVIGEAMISVVSILGCRAIDVACLVEVLVLLHQFAGIQVPQEDFTVVRSREKAANALRIVHAADVILVIVEGRERMLAVDFLVAVVRSQLLVALVVLFVRFESPDADCCVVGARDESIDFLDELHLVDPVCVPVQVGNQLKALAWIAPLSLLVLHLHHLVVYMPELDKAISAGGKEVAGLCVGSLRGHDNHVVDAVAVLCLRIVVAKHHR